MKYSFFCLGFLLFTMTVVAYDWPAPDLKVRKTFGQKIADGYLPGLEFETTSQDLTTSDKGDVLFVFSPGAQRVQNLPSGLGGFVALAHDDNLRTVVTNLTPAFSETKMSFQKGDIIGSAPIPTGSSTARHQLFVFDQQLGEIVNPFLVFPTIQDAKAPIIFDVKAIPEGGANVSSLFSRSTFSVGYWTLLVDVADPATAVPNAPNEKGAEIQRGVYAIEAYLNGAEVFGMNLNSLREKNGRWLIKENGKPLDDLFVQDREWNLGQVFFNQGTNILELVVRDFQGNETGRTFRFLGSRS